MSKILNLGNEYDLWISYTWSRNNHGICGHIFEVIDYYYILKNHFKVGIFIGEEIDWQIFEKIIRSKYAFSEEEILDIKDNTIFNLRPSLLRGRNILFTDGGIINSKEYTLLFDKIFYFACGNKEIKDNTDKNVYILQDDRVYEPVKLNGINYKKKILFDKLKKFDNCEKNILIYATKNCRKIQNYSEYKKYGDKILVIVSEKKQFINDENFIFLIPPVENLFQKFDIFVYTPVERKWDCSPRFIAECKYFNKKVIFHKIDYWNEDKGLYWRVWDIENNFNSLHLKKDDNIVSILKGKIC